jgi:hypothetical protein
MALVSVEDQAYTDGNDFIDDAVNGIDTVLQSAGWTLLDELDATNDQQDRVYSSSGVDTNQELFLRVTHEGLAVRRVHFRAYSLWDAGTSTGYNEVGTATGTTCIVYPAGAFDAWLVANLDHIALVVDFDGGTTYNKFFGGLVTATVAAQHVFNGRLGPSVTGFNAAADTALRLASGTTWTGIEDMQYLWVVGQNTAAYPSASEKVQVAAYTPATETIDLVAPLSDDHGMSAIVSLVPQEIVLWGDTTGQLSTATPLAIHSSDAYTDTSMSWTSLLDSVGLAVVPSTDYGEYPLANVMLYDAAVGQKNVMGTLPRFLRAPTGSAVAEDDFEVSADRYVNFPDGAGFFALQVT